MDRRTNIITEVKGWADITSVCPYTSCRPHITWISHIHRVVWGCMAHPVTICHWSITVVVKIGGSYIFLAIHSTVFRTAFMRTGWVPNKSKISHAVVNHYDSRNEEEENDMWQEARNQHPYWPKNIFIRMFQTVPVKNCSLKATSQPLYNEVNLKWIQHELVSKFPG